MSSPSSERAAISRAENKREHLCYCALSRCAQIQVAAVGSERGKLECLPNRKRRFVTRNDRFELELREEPLSGSSFALACKLFNPRDKLHQLRDCMQAGRAQEESRARTALARSLLARREQCELRISDSLGPSQRTDDDRDSSIRTNCKLSCFASRLI